MYEFPMNRWYVSRYIRSAKPADFETAVTAIRDALEEKAKRPYDLKLTFFRAADPATAYAEGAPAPAIVMHSTDTLRDLTGRRWRRADYVEARLTPRPEPGAYVSMPAKFEEAVITARWPDIRRIDMRVEPREHGREISRKVLDNYFTLWIRGYDFS